MSSDRPLSLNISFEAELNPTSSLETDSFADPTPSTRLSLSNPFSLSLSNSEHEENPQFNLDSPFRMPFQEGHSLSAPTRNSDFMISDPLPRSSPMDLLEVIPATSHTHKRKQEAEAELTTKRQRLDSHSHSHSRSPALPQAPVPLNFSAEEQTHIQGIYWLADSLVKTPQENMADNVNYISLYLAKKPEMAQLLESFNNMIKSRRRQPKSVGVIFFHMILELPPSCDPLKKIMLLFQIYMGQAPLAAELLKKSANLKYTHSPRYRKFQACKDKVAIQLRYAKKATEDELARLAVQTLAILIEQHANGELSEEEIALFLEVNSKDVKEKFELALTANQLCPAQPAQTLPANEEKAPAHFYLNQPHSSPTIFAALAGSDSAFESTMNYHLNYDSDEETAVSPPSIPAKLPEEPAPTPAAVNLSTFFQAPSSENPSTEREKGAEAQPEAKTSSHDFFQLEKTDVQASALSLDFLEKHILNLRKVPIKAKNLKEFLSLPNSIAINKSLSPHLQNPVSAKFLATAKLADNRVRAAEFFYRLSNSGLQYQATLELFLLKIAQLKEQSPQLIRLLESSACKALFEQVLQKRGEKTLKR